jgi:hypothetical protein
MRLSDQAVPNVGWFSNSGRGDTDDNTVAVPRSTRTRSAGPAPSSRIEPSASRSRPDGRRCERLERGRSGWRLPALRRPAAASLRHDRQQVMMRPRSTRRLRRQQANGAFSLLPPDMTRVSRAFMKCLQYLSKLRSSDGGVIHFLFIARAPFIAMAWASH